MRYDLLRRIAVGSGALTIALTTAFGGVAAADVPSATTFELAVQFDKADYGSGDDVSGTVTIKNTDPGSAHGAFVRPFGTNLSTWHFDEGDNEGVAVPAGGTLVLGFTASIADPDQPIAMTVDLKASPNLPSPTLLEAYGTATVTKVTGSADGVLYFDANGNGQYDQGEGLAGATVKFSGGVPYHDEPLLTTDSDGRFAVTDIPAGHYWPTVSGVGGLVAPSIDVHLGEQPQHILVEARHKVSDTLDASLALNADTYVVGDIAHVTVTLTNTGEQDLAGISTRCNQAGDQDQLTGAGTGWGDLRRGGSGVIVPADSTMTFDVTEAVRPGSGADGRVRVVCQFGQFGDGFETGVAVSNTASAHVTS